MLRKIIDCEDLEISRENAYDRVYFNKVANLQCTDYNSAIKRVLHRVLWNIFPKAAILKRIFLEKILWRTSALLSFGLVVHNPQFYQKYICIHTSRKRLSFEDVVSL